MASVARSLSRTALSIARQTTSRQKPTKCLCLVPQHSRRPFSITPFPLNQKQEAGPDTPVASADSTDDQDEESLERRRPGGTASDSALNAQMLRDIDRDVNEIERQMPLHFETPKTKIGFWGEDEEDEWSRTEDDDDDFKDDAITSMAHAELEQHRELREYARIIAWDMPSLSALAKPFSLPPQTHILRFRYTTYMGETHPAESKVVVELCSKDLTPTYLTEDQRITFLKLVGPRYNPDTDIIRMSCEKFPSRAQNKRYLGDLVENLISEAKEGDSFADIPLDLRHHTSKKKLSFPTSWAMTEERRRELESLRNERLKIERSRTKVVDGNEVVVVAVKSLPALSQASPRGAAGAGRKEAVSVKAGRGRGPQKSRSIW
ncbi:37S ribosomal protein Rsm24 [Coccidioides immitis RS]|uniref:37S ribosomal protein Rsm24 n=3 Tax=Coccidioides immitis TaxID=5501 RepID=A0A0E1RY99_COCIM|nr:37S ribosomal protein Rsm24 [Coccidioides immitis RS]EAS35196.1 37S ribosomal protein Rsm24 [Coccidioides immitis RS]KMP00424.1 hypothetical protein CIRG_00566 [Coccidioides immitis RMSCC 2394]KMU84620.1 hypothetical protein CIHG_02404 [Coccidioides immitis H538.4]TPX26510.1 37S ribosomal protein S24, mitochondrial [Coccidioides immitis]